MAFEDSDYWIYQYLNPGNYRVRFTYKQSRIEMETFYNSWVETSILQEVWTGEVITPPVEFSIFQP